MDIDATNPLSESELNPTITLYAVVYGSSWEDIAYFTDIQKAKIKLVIQTLSNHYDKYYPPFLNEYVSFNGNFFRTKNKMYVDHITMKLMGFTDTEILENPSLALKSIKYF